MGILVISLMQNYPHFFSNEGLCFITLSHTYDKVYKVASKDRPQGIRQQSIYNPPICGQKNEQSWLMRSNGQISSKLN